MTNPTTTSTPTSTFTTATPAPGPVTATPMTTAAVTTTPSTTTSTSMTDRAISIRPGKTLQIWIESVAVGPKCSKSKVIRRALSLGLPWVKEPTLYRRMRSMMKALQKISSAAIERKKEVAHLERLVSAIHKVSNTPVETQVQIENMLTLMEHIARQLLKVLEEIHGTRNQLAAFQHFTPDDCSEICRHLEKVATASSSNDRRDRIKSCVQLLRSVGGI